MRAHPTKIEIGKLVGAYFLFLTGLLAFAVRCHPGNAFWSKDVTLLVEKDWGTLVLRLRCVKIFNR